jgi:hypothetical protein
LFNFLFVDKIQNTPTRIHSPDPFLRAGNHHKKFSRDFAKSFSPENSFGKIESTESPLRIPSVSPLKEKLARAFLAPFQKKFKNRRKQKSMDAGKCEGGTTDRERKRNSPSTCRCSVSFAVVDATA